jgi:hypothetical protein
MKFNILMQLIHREVNISTQIIAFSFKFQNFEPKYQ